MTEQRELYRTARGADRTAALGAARQAITDAPDLGITRDGEWDYIQDLAAGDDLLLEALDSLGDLDPDAAGSFGALLARELEDLDAQRQDRFWRHRLRFSRGSGYPARGELRRLPHTWGA